jgi:hypothetical protein
MEIIYITEHLHHIYPGQTTHQPIYALIDFEKGEITAEYNSNIGSGVPMKVWSGRTMRFNINLMSVKVTNELLDRIKPMAEEALKGFSSQIRDNNLYAIFTDEAKGILIDIEALCRETKDETYQLWDASDWLILVTNEELGLTPQTDLEALAKELETQAKEDGLTIYNLKKTLEMRQGSP